ncbi:MAG: CIA30 family protein [Pseudomonadota bacterium]|jgi:monofunctional biosynthetic peptidoglycan transglycosylase
MALIFETADEQQRWFAVDDGVMGGVSHSTFSVSESCGWFHGEVSLDNGGGFASVRRQPDEFEASLTQAAGIRLTVKGDGRPYQLRLKSRLLSDACAYRVIMTPPADEWATLSFPWQAFEAIRRGSLLADAPPLEAASITQLGFLIADRTAGPFCLGVQRLEPSDHL